MIQRTALSLVSFLFFCLAWVAPAGAQDQSAAKQQVSDAFVRSAVSLIDYTQVIEGEAPSVLSSTLLDAALKLTPDNAEAWAMRVELARGTPGTEDDEQALVKYLATGVRDDRASYELIRLRLAKSNTLDAQLRALEQLLDSDAGRAIEPALRSRLAMLASTMGLELLDEQTRRKWLIEAVRSDPANAEAATTMLDLIIELGGDDVRRGTAMINVIRAMPLDAGPRLQLAELLADHGAHALAASQYEVVATRLSRQPLSIDDYRRWANCLVISGQNDVALRLIEEFEKALNQPSAEREALAEDAGPTPLPLGLAIARMAALSDDAEGSQKVFDEIAGVLRKIIGEAEEQTTKSEASDQLTLLAAVSCPNLEQARQIVEQQKQVEGSIEWVNTVARGWLALRNNDVDQARQLLGPIADKHALASCGLALAVGVDDAGKAKLLQDVMRDLPAISSASLVAGRELNKLGQAPTPTTTGKAILNLMNKYPQSFWRVDLERAPWLAVRFSIDPARIKPMQPVEAEVTVWNSATFPLRISESGPIQPNAIVLVNAKTSGKALPPTNPIVIDLKRRFSLAGGERMIFKTRLDYHQFGMLRQTNPDRAFVFDAKLIVNPWLNPAGLWLPSGIGKSADVRNALIQARGNTQAAIDDWLKAVDSDVPAERLEALGRLAALSSAASPEVVTEDVLNQLRPKMTEQWNKADDLTKAWILLSASPLGEEGASYPQLAELATQSDSPLVWLSLLMTHATAPDSPFLRRAIARQDLPEVSRFGERLRRLLREMDRIRAENEAAIEP